LQEGGKSNSISSTSSTTIGEFLLLEYAMPAPTTLDTGGGIIGVDVGVASPQILEEEDLKSVEGGGGERRLSLAENTTFL
jgi:hypothetical protein